MSLHVIIDLLKLFCHNPPGAKSLQISYCYPLRPTYDQLIEAEFTAVTSPVDFR